jgi:hypothetical protein
MEGFRMKLSVFPEAKAHPKNKAEKKRESFKVSDPYLPVTVEVTNDEELIDAVTNYAWSPIVFDGFRHGDNYVSCDLLVYDIDDGLTIDETERIVQERSLCCLCLPSPSHTDTHHKFRIVLPLAYAITNTESYTATWLAGAEIFKVADEQCKDIARFYFGSTMNDGFWQEGKLFEPVDPPKKLDPNHTPSSSLMLPVSRDIKATVEAIYGEPRTKIPEIVEFFIRHAGTGLEGKWINSLNSFCFSLALSGVPDDVILQTCEQLAPEELDDKDLYQIRKAIKDGTAERDVEELTNENT